MLKRFLASRFLTRYMKPYQERVTKAKLSGSTQAINKARLKRTEAVHDMLSSSLKNSQQ